MQVICPKCGNKGLLQTITQRYHRVRHTIKIPYFSMFIHKMCYNRDFAYCRVDTHWALEQFDAENKRYNEYLKELLQRQ
jgi:hypothetical protein